MRRRTARTALVALTAVPLALAACSSSSSSPGATTKSTAAPASPPTTSAGPPGNSPSTTGLPPSNNASTTSTTAASAQVPPVTNATNLKVAPVVGAGSPPPPTQLHTKDLVVGSGQAAVASDTVTLQVVGTNYLTGKVFYSTWTSGGATSFPLNGVVPGFEQGVVGMKVGGRREIVIPAALGYGTAGSPTQGGTQAVGPNESIVFVVDLVSVQSS